ncbi:MAG: RNA polymerase sigma-70 factor [Paludibacter sp.]
MLSKDILAGLKNGNDDAYKCLYEEYYIKLCRLANWYIRDSFVSENLVGDLIFYLWENREEIEIRDSLNAYLFTSIRNRCYNYLSQAHVQKESSITELQENSLIFSMHSETDLPIGILMEKELQNVIDVAISRLPEQTKKVFELKRYEDLSYEDISAQLNISINTVKYHIKSALKFLREELGEFLTAIILLLFLS